MMPSASPRPKFALRGEKRFPSVEDLVSQMHRDVAEAREICAKYENRAA